MVAGGGTRQWARRCAALAKLDRWSRNRRPSLNALPALVRGLRRLEGSLGDQGRSSRGGSPWCVFWRRFRTWPRPGTGFPRGLDAGVHGAHSGRRSAGFARHRARPGFRGSDPVLANLEIGELRARLFDLASCVLSAGGSRHAQSMEDKVFLAELTKPSRPSSPGWPLSPETKTHERSEIQVERVAFPQRPEVGSSTPAAAPPPAPETWSAPPCAGDSADPIEEVLSDLRDLDKEELVLGGIELDLEASRLQDEVSRLSTENETYAVGSRNSRKDSSWLRNALGRSRAPGVCDPGADGPDRGTRPAHGRVGGPGCKP